VAAGEVVGSILLPGDELLRVEKLTVGAGANLINDSGLKVDEDGPRHVLACTGLTEERVERIVCYPNRGITESSTKQQY
jgi:hypothetical protein